MDIDFFEDALSYIENKKNSPADPKKEQEEKTTDSPLNITSLEEEEAQPETENKRIDYVINDEENTITIEGKSHLIPNYYNKEMILKRDKDTIDMVLISAGYGYLIYNN